MEREYRKKFEGFFVRNKSDDIKLLLEYFLIKNPEWSNMTTEERDAFVDLSAVVEPMKNAKVITEERLQEEYDKVVVEE